EGLDGARLGHDQRVRRVVKPVRRRDVLGLVLHLSLERREHDVRQIDADDVEPVARQGVHLVPHDGAPHSRLVLDDGFYRGAFLLQHELLVPRRDVGFATGRKRLPVHQVLLRAGRPAPPLSLRATSRRVNGCFSRSTSESGMPGPRSATWSTTAPSSARTATLTSFSPYRSALSMRFSTTRRIDMACRGSSGTPEKSVAIDLPRRR